MRRNATRGRRCLTSSRAPAPQIPALTSLGFIGWVPGRDRAAAKSPAASCRDRLATGTLCRATGRRHGGHASPVRPTEVEAAGVGAPYGEAVLVDEAMVKATQQDEVVLARRAAVRPVLDVV